MSKKRLFSSQKWLNEYFTDPYVKKAHKNKIRSRAWFKLDDINNNYRLFKRGMTVIDLGSAPGSWSEYVSKKVGQSGHVIAFDILPMLPISNVTFIQGDIENKCSLSLLLNNVKNKKVNAIISDMAPNMSGHNFIDHIKIIRLNKIVLRMSEKLLSINGYLLLKSFHGIEFSVLLKKIYNLFLEIKICKPNASRSRSREVYILASGRKN